MPDPALHTTASQPVFVVLDTNVVLDLWVFDDIPAAPLRAALAAGHLLPLATAPMLAELADVLGRPFVTARPVDPAAVLHQVRAACRLVPEVPVAAPRTPRCTDGDDQKFIDLAWCWPARWLFSRDRAVLRLARRARAHGLGIVTPQAWAALPAAAEALG